MQVIQYLQDQKLLTSTALRRADQVTSSTSCGIIRGRTAKFGTWMQGPDYTQWHGAYEVVKLLAELQGTIRRAAEERGEISMYLLAEVFPIVRRLRIPFNRDQFMLLLAAFNVIVLGVDTYLAHAISGTIRGYEWIPIIFGPIAGVILLAAGLIALRRRMLANLIGSLVFLATLLVAALGTYFHLNRALLPDAPAGQAITATLLIYAPPLLSPLTFGLVALLGLSAAWQEDPVDSGILVPAGRAAPAHALPQDPGLLLYDSPVHPGDRAFQRARPCPHQLLPIPGCGCPPSSACLPQR